MDNGAKGKKKQNVKNQKLWDKNHFREWDSKAASEKKGGGRGKRGWSDGRSVREKGKKIF